MFSAISRLVGKGAAVGEAWLDIPLAEGERRAQAIRDDKIAHSALVKIIQDAASAEAIKDPDLLKRAIFSWGGERLRKQTNKEEVARKAADFATSTPMENDAKVPGDDWMNLFESHAERASSEEVRSLWGRVLDGEVRKPGAFSLRGLNFIATLDADMALIVEEFAPYLIENNLIVAIPAFRRSPYYDKLLALAGEGLIGLNSSFQFSFPKHGPAVLNCINGGEVVFQAEAGRTYFVPGSVLTKLGREIFSLAHGERGRDKEEEFIQALEASLSSQCAFRSLQ
jgi:hypothetical protein